MSDATSKVEQEDFEQLLNWQRIARRQRFVLEQLAAAGEPRTKAQMIAALEQHIPTTAEERKLTPSGDASWHSTFLWSTTGLVKAGWMTKDGYGVWRITAEGIEALQRFTDPEDLFRETNRRYREWEKEKASNVRRAWLLRGSAVLGVDLVPTWLAEGFCSVAASQLDLRKKPTEQEIEQLVEEAYSHLKHHERRAKVDEIVSFVTRMKPGDIVVTMSQGQVYVGDVEGEWESVSSEGGRSNLRRAVDWRNEDAPVDFADLPEPLPSQFGAGATLVDLTAHVGVIDALTEPAAPVIDGEEGASTATPPELVRHEHLREPSPDLADRLFVDAAWLSEVRLILDERKQLVFHGPPGTGKTFIARKLAEDLVGPENVKLVQFHPAYTYEDFFEGYRPIASQQSGALAFDLRPGPLRQIADLARERADQAFVLIIDEINRANLAKVFGELYFLLEYRDQAVDLLYSPDERFTLPGNLYLIGTMNTADRSIALIDAAMRRRFAFVALDPSTEPTKSLLRRWSDEHGLGSLAADLLDELNRRIEDPDFQVGPSYFMKRVADDAFSHERLDRIWRTAILPLLQEHHYGEWESLGKRYALASLLSAIRPSAE